MDGLFCLEGAVSNGNCSKVGMIEFPNIKLLQRSHPSVYLGFSYPRNSIFGSTSYVWKWCVYRVQWPVKILFRYQSVCHGQSHISKGSKMDRKWGSRKVLQVNIVLRMGPSGSPIYVEINTTRQRIWDVSWITPQSHGSVVAVLGVNIIKYPKDKQP